MAVSVLVGGFENTDGKNVFCLQGWQGVDL